MYAAVAVLGEGRFPPRGGTDGTDHDCGTCVPCGVADRVVPPLPATWGVPSCLLFRGCTTRIGKGASQRAAEGPLTSMRLASPRAVVYRQLQLGKKDRTPRGSGGVRCTADRVAGPGLPSGPSHASNIGGAGRRHEGGLRPPEGGSGAAAVALACWLTWHGEVLFKPRRAAL